MSVLHAVHTRLIKIPGWRRYQRRLSRRVKAIAGTPDAYGDLFAIAKIIDPVAVLDIGSYIGDTIERFTDELETMVYGFEPTPETFEKLKRRFADNPQVQVSNCALSNKEGTQTLFCNNNPQTNSLLDNDIGNERSFLEDTKHIDTAQIDVRTMDGWCSLHLPSQGDLIVKADVQGGEGRLLDGGQETFRDRIKAFYGEVQLSPMYKDQTSFADLNNLLSSAYGFSLYNMYPCLRDSFGRAVEVDALWVKDELLLQTGN
ncbi:MAG: FkbM family methyltransferase [Kiritimatiellae bacterium]|nr:FkbM family methyltransferase [Kiritimatiellia bacterium]